MGNIVEEFVNNEEEDTQKGKFLTFTLGKETYGIDIKHVIEIIGIQQITEVPQLPEYIRGIINLRGQVLSVIDIRRFFDLPVKGLSNLNRVLVIETPEMEVGMLADAILGVRLIPPNQIQPTLPTLTGIRAQYLKGVTNEGLVILDVKKIVTDDRIVVYDEIEV